MRKRIVIILFLAVLVAAGVYAFRGANATPSNRIVISGNIELTEVNVAFKTAGRLIERTVDEGDSVKKGQLIARLDRDQLTAQRERELAGLKSAESQLEQARTALEWQRSTLTADLEQRNADIASNEARLSELRSGARPQERLDSQAAVDAAQSEVDRAQKDWDRAQVLHKNDDISTAQFDQYRSRVESAQAALKSAKERQSLVLAGPRSEVIRAQEAMVDRAKGALRVSQANQLEIKRREQELSTRSAEIERSRASIAMIDAQLSDTVATSPVDGVVLVKSADTGEILSPGTTIVTIGDIEHPWLRGYINETDLGKVKIGTPVKVRTDTYKDKTYDGQISFIASEAEFTPKQIQTQQERVKLVYRVKIDVKNPNRELKSNMPADAEIILN